MRLKPDQVQDLLAEKGCLSSSNTLKRTFRFRPIAAGRAAATKDRFGSIPAVRAGRPFERVETTFPFRRYQNPWPSAREGRDIYC
jgi:hypothetical protein